MILRVAVPSPLYRYFDYLPPAQLDVGDVPAAGVRVSVPFGHQQHVGVLIEVCDDSPLPKEKLRRAHRVLDQQPVLDDALLSLLRWAQRYYHHPPGEVIAAALPVMLRQGAAPERQIEPLWRLTEAGRAALAERQMPRAPRQRALAELLERHPGGLTAAALRTAFDDDDAAVAALGRSLRALHQKRWLAQSEALPQPAAVETPLRASAEQTAAIDEVGAAVEAGEFAAFLLDGVTGSGKTEVYLRLIERALDADRQTLVLVPEIGLTPQLLERFRRRLSTRLAVLHSGLTGRERLNAWALARDGEAGVVIGTRSAVFTPLPRPGLIVIDEEHDASFKQQDGFRYSARDLALVRAKRAGVPILLGSATPALESLYNAGRDRYRRLVLSRRVGDAVEPTIELLDVRRQPMQAGLSEPLLAAVQTRLERGEQALLFLNRRGFAPTLICHECGWLGQCHSCDARLTLHRARRRLQCHHCGADQPLPSACPGCGSIDLRALGQGTERIEDVLQTRFAAHGIARIDRDSTQRKGSLQRLLADIREGRRRLLIGTQMLSKGHHFPDVTLVGIVDADQGLFGTDYRASERMAQQILQVSGRAGRADKPGTVMIQTHHPTHPLLLTLAERGYAAFAASALREREAVQLPPYTSQALLRAEAADPEPAQQFLHDAAALQRPLAERQRLELLGPVPAPMQRRAGRYRSQLLLQGHSRAALHGFLRVWVGQLGELKSARKVRWSLDVDPIDLL